MKKEITVNDLNGLPAAARQVLNDAGPHRIFAISGKMGAGKTTLIKAFCDVLGVQEIVASPTFAIVNEYTDKQNESVFHFDFYRIKKIEEVFDIGYEEYFYSGNYCFMEWPELIMDLLPESYVDLKISAGNSDERLISYSV